LNLHVYSGHMAKSCIVHTGLGVVMFSMFLIQPNVRGACKHMAHNQLMNCNIT